MSAKIKTKKTSVFIHPYNGASGGAKTLTEALNGKRILTGGRSRFKYSKGKTVINWGSSEYHVPEDTPMLNNPSNVAIASNKLKFFQKLANSGTRLVPFTTDVDEVQQWLDEGSTVCARTKLTGHSGEGLVIMSSEEGGEKELDISEAKLYTKYVKKAREYRVHVFHGKVIRVQKKILKPELTARIQDDSDSLTKDDINWEVRNHGNGFIYVTDGVMEECPQDVKKQALSAVRNTGLDFGAVDLIWNNRKEQSFVLEINTSPGLEGGTVDAYVTAFQEFISSGESINKKSINVYDEDQLREIWGGRPIEDYSDSLRKTAQGKVTHSHWSTWDTASAVTGIPRDELAAAHRTTGGVSPAVQEFAQNMCAYLDVSY